MELNKILEKPISEIIEEVKEELRKIYGDKADKVIDILEGIGYFVETAGTHHHVYAGGLVKHSYEVWKIAEQIRKSLKIDIEPELLTLACLFHDLGKVGNYEPNVLKSGKISEARPYKFNPEIPIPHQVMSIYLLLENKFVDNSFVLTAIYHHHGFYDDSTKQFINYIKKDKSLTTLWWLLHTADIISSYLS